MSKKLILIPVVLFVADRLTKYLALTFVPKEGVFWFWGGLVTLINRGIAFRTPLPQWIILIAVPIMIVIIGLWVRMELREHRTQHALAMLIIMQGAMSNLLDRFLYGGVLDVLYLRHYSSLNLADVMIVAGAFLLAKSTIKKRKSQPTI